MASAEEQTIREFARHGTWVYLKWATPAATITAYLIGTSLGLSSTQGLLATATVLPPIILLMGALYPYVCLRLLAAQALRHQPYDPPGARLARLLELPWRATTFITIPTWIVGGFAFSLCIVTWLGLDMLHLVAGALIPSCFGVVLAAPVGLDIEQAVLPHALEERRKHPTLTFGSSLFRPRQSWFMPFTHITSMLALLVMSACVVAAKLSQLESAARQGETLAHTRVGHWLMLELGQDLLWVCVLVLVLPTITYWRLARRQARGAGAVGEAIEALAHGKAVPPAWVSTDEMGDLAAGMNAVLARLQQLPQRLHTSATRLLTAGNRLSVANLEQQESLTRQAAAIQEVQVTVEEIRQTSQLAASRSEEILKVAGRSESLGQQGESAIEQSMAGLTSIQEFVASIQGKLRRLQESASKIGSITDTVKSLSDRSNMLALNAAIEAVRSGEHGRGFGVVAREIRTLANQSSTATARINDILEDVTSAIRDAADMGERGALQLDSGLERMRTSSHSLRELSKLAQQNSAAVRQIATAITQQNTGVTQVFTAIDDLAQTMDSTLDRLKSTQEAASVLQVVSHEVSQMAEQLEG